MAPVSTDNDRPTDRRRLSTTLSNFMNELPTPSVTGDWPALSRAESFPGAVVCFIVYSGKTIKTCQTDLNAVKSSCACVYHFFLHFLKSRHFVTVSQFSAQNIHKIRLIAVGVRSV